MFYNPNELEYQIGICNEELSALDKEIRMLNRKKFKLLLYLKALKDMKEE